MLLGNADSLHRNTGSVFFIEASIFLIAYIKAIQFSKIRCERNAYSMAFAIIFSNAHLDIGEN